MCLFGLAWLLSFVLHLFGQQRQQVDGNVVLTLLLFQAVHHAGREGESTEVQRERVTNTG